MQRIRRTRPTPTTPEPVARVRRTRPAPAAPAPKREPFRYHWKLGERRRDYMNKDTVYEVVGYGPDVVQVKCVQIMGTPIKDDLRQARSWFQDKVFAEMQPVK